MSTRVKRLSGLGLGAVLTAGILSACGAPDTPESEPAPASEEQEAPAATEAPADTETPAPASAAGEGEGGVTIELAATDPVVYKSGLAIAEAHVLAARDAFKAGETEAAAEMFAHPVSEVLFDMEEILQAQGVEDFTDLLTDASAAVFAGENEEQISKRTDEIIGALRAAAEKAPDDGSSAAYVAGGVVSDQIERASDMYRLASESEFYEPYLDGYGFYKAAAAIFAENEAVIEAENPEEAAAIRNALEVFETAYPTAVRPDELDASQSALAVASSNIILARSE